MLNSKLKTNKGAALVEYVLLTGLIGVVALGAAASFGSKVTQTFSTTSNELRTASLTSTNDSLGATTVTPPIACEPGFYYTWVATNPNPLRVSDAPFNTAGDITDASAIISAGTTTALNSLADSAAPESGFYAETTFLVDTASNYTFSMDSDDGAIIYINGVSVVDDSFLHAVRTVSGDVVLAAGEHSFKVNYFNRAAASTFRVLISGGNIAIPTPLQNIQTEICH